MTKNSITKNITGAVFFILALFFSLALLAGYSHTDLFHGFFGRLMTSTGNLFIDSYGICSILIPVFLFTVAMILFLADITFKKCIYISFSLIPFFTAVSVEKSWQNNHHDLSQPIEIVKLTLIIISTLLFMAIEFLLSGLIAEKIVKAKNSRKKFTAKEFFNSEDTTVFDSNFDNTEEQTSTEPYDDKYQTTFIKGIEPDIPSPKPNMLDSSLTQAPHFPELNLPSEPEQDILHFDQSADFEDNDPSIEDDEYTMLDQTHQADYENNIEPDSDEQNPDEIENDYEENFDYMPEDENLESAELEPDPQTEQPEFIESNESQDNPVEESESTPCTDGVSGIFAQMERDIRSKLNSESFQPDSTAEVEHNDKKSEPKSSSKKSKKYSIPVSGLLNEYADEKYWIIDEQTNSASRQLKETLEEFKIAAEVTGIRKGPVVTMFEILPAPGVKLSKIVALQDNIALRLAASSVRIVAPIPGKRAVGIEIPNSKRAIVSFREIIEKDLPEYKKMAIPVVLGKDIQGEPQLLDIAKTPHLLIAGSTGSGKSVCVNSLILSILYKRSPDKVKLILIDPKVVELKLYNDIPHLLTPVITEPKKAFQSLQYCLCEMERRYAMLDKMGVRDIINYNKRIEERQLLNEKLPYIVVIIDEFADLMATTGKELESTIARLAAMSRAVGIHLVLATQRPSVDVITGLIKANIPSRIAFMVASKMDSRVIIDQVGAEKLLGCGDMLYASATDPFPVRIQGTFMSDQEVENVVEYVKQFGPPEYIDEDIFVPDDDDDMAEPSLFSDGDDPLYEKALSIVLEAGKASASYIQRRLKIGYNRAARLVEEMEARGIVGPANGSKPRDILHMP